MLYAILYMEYPEWLIQSLVCPESGSALQPQKENLYVSNNGKKYYLKDNILSIKPEYYAEESLPLPNDFISNISNKMIYSFQNKKIRDDVLKYLKKNKRKRFLEISSRQFYYQKDIRSALGNDVDMVAANTSWNILKKCQKESKKLKISLFYVNHFRLPFKENTFDIVFSFGNIASMKYPTVFLNECVRISKSGGLIIWGDKYINLADLSLLNKNIMLKHYPDALKPMPDLPNKVYGVQKYFLHHKKAYLVIANKQ